MFPPMYFFFVVDELEIDDERFHRVQFQGKKMWLYIKGAIQLIVHYD